MKDEKPWDKQPGETAKSFARFDEYLKAGPSRRLRDIQLKHKKGAGYLTQLKNWSTKYNWVARASAYDAEQYSTEGERIDGLRQMFLDKVLDQLPEIMDRLIDIATDPIEYPHSVHFRAIEKVLSLAGLDSPQKVEVAGTKGSDIRTSVKQSLGTATTTELKSILRLVNAGKR